MTQAHEWMHRLQPRLEDTLGQQTIDAIFAAIVQDLSQESSVDAIALQ